jgi:SAM-dependent methyltransferase
MAETDGAGAAQEHINAYWDVRSRSYDGDPGHGILDEEERRAWLAALADVLDAGTGTGFLAFLLADLGHRVTGIDLSEDMLSAALARAAAAGGAHLDAERWWANPFPEPSPDFVPGWNGEAGPWADSLGLGYGPPVGAPPGPLDELPWAWRAGPPDADAPPPVQGGGRPSRRRQRRDPVPPGEGDPGYW